MIQARTPVNVVVRCGDGSEDPARIVGAFIDPYEAKHDAQARGEAEKREHVVVPGTLVLAV